MRKKKNLDIRMERVSDLLIEEPANLKGGWSRISGGRPVHIEIGCGKGRFICRTAKANPETFFVAIERVPDVLVMAMEKAQAEGCENIVFINSDAGILTDFFEGGEAARIYLNFSDPWPANRHRDRRLTSERFLKQYEQVLAGGEVFFKTDNTPLFNFSLGEFERCGWTLDRITFDLHGSGSSVPSEKDGGAMTEYEERFTGMGVKINRAEARIG